MKKAKTSPLLVVGTRVWVESGALSPFLRAYVAAVRKNGNIVLARRPGEKAYPQQYSVSSDDTAFMTGSSSAWSRATVYLATPELDKAAEERRAVLQHRRRADALRKALERPEAFDREFLDEIARGIAARALRAYLEGRF